MVDLDLLEELVLLRFRLLVLRRNLLLFRRREEALDAGLDRVLGAPPDRLLLQRLGAKHEVVLGILVEAERLHDEPREDAGLQNLDLVWNVGDIRGRPDHHRVHVGDLVRAVVDEELALGRIGGRHDVEKADRHDDDGADDAGDHAPAPAKPVDDVAEIDVVYRLRRDIDDRPIGRVVMARLVGNLPLHRCNSPAKNVYR